MIKKLIILLKIGRALAKSSTLDYFQEIYKPNIFVRVFIKIFGFSSFKKKSLDSKSVGLRLTNALKDLGPTFIKLGQFLGTRPDIVGKDLAIQEGKPVEMAEKIAKGRLNKFFKETTLINQVFIRDNKKTVGQFLKETNPDLMVTDFKRYSLSI